MRGPWCVGVVTLAALSACDFDRAYTRYCEGHPGSCGAERGDGGTYPAVGGVEISAGTDLEPSTCSTQALIPGVRLSTVNDAGEVVAAPVSGSVILTVGPTDGLELFAGEGCLGTRLGQYTEFPLAAGEALDRSFSMRARQAGQFRVGVMRSLPGFTEPEWKPVRVLSRLAFAGVPQAAPASTCIGPLALIVQNPAGTSGLTVNEDSVVTLSAGNGPTFHPDVSCASLPLTSVLLPVDAGQSELFWVKAGAASPLRLSAFGPTFKGQPIIDTGSDSVVIAPTPPTCVASGKPCFDGGIDCCTGLCTPVSGYLKCP